MSQLSPLGRMFSLIVESQPCAKILPGISGSFILVLVGFAAVWVIERSWGQG